MEIVHHIENESHCIPTLYNKYQIITMYEKDLNKYS